MKGQPPAGRRFGWGSEMDGDQQINLPVIK